MQESRFPCAAPKCAARIAFVLLAAAAGFLPAHPSRAEDAPDAAASTQTEVLWEWSAYYTSVGLHVPLTREAPPDGGQMEEWEVYRHLLRRSLEPRILLLEASIYPMPMLGVWLRNHHPGFYRDAAIGGANGVNLVDAFTAGFPEPWAVSIFLGNQMRFSKAGEPQRDTNRGYMGYLLSVGTRHIHRNVLIDSDWAELEWKLKGERRFENERLAWSFRAGARLYRHPDISDLYYFGIERANLNFGGPLSWLSNSHISLKTELTRTGTSLAQQELIFGRKIPLDAQRVALSVDVGVIYERDVKYTGPLATPGVRSTTFVIRPNIEF